MKKLTSRGADISRAKGIYPWLRHAMSVVLLIGFCAVPLVAQEASRGVRIYPEEREDGGYVFYADNENIIPYWVSVDFPRIQNLESNLDIPWRGAVPAGTEGFYLFELRVADSREGYSYSMSWRPSPGDPATVQPDDFAYLFPYAHGTKHAVTQGHNGDFTHFDDNQYALDFDLDIGTPVHAARGGLVVEVKEDSDIGGPGIQYGRYANYVLVYHEDGTFGNYVHLMLDGAVVEPGDTVEAGELIGYSGNTGRSSGPHLHFDVRIPTFDGGMDSIPVQLVDHEGNALIPQEGEVYYASHPGGPEFEAVFGSDLTNADYAGYEARIDRTDNIEFRTEEVDRSYVLFVGNGFEYPIEATLEMRSSGLDSTRDFPFEIYIPARTEVFVTIMHSRPDARRTSYAPSIRYRRAD